MLDLYYFATPNGQKARVMLEELGLPYNLHLVNIRDGSNLSPDYAKVSPHRRIPTLVDSDGPGGKPINIIESHTIMTYLADKTNSALYPTDPATRFAVDQWALHGQSTFGPTFANVTLFETRFPEDVPSAKKHFNVLGLRCMDTIELHLKGKENFVGDYSIADIAHFTWVNRLDQANITFDDFPNVKRWFDRIAARPQVQRGLKAD
jgi:GST-like protein